MGVVSLVSAHTALDVSYIWPIVSPSCASVLPLFPLVPAPIFAAYRLTTTRSVVWFQARRSGPCSTADESISWAEKLRNSSKRVVKPKSAAYQPSSHFLLLTRLGVGLDRPRHVPPRGLLVAESVLMLAQRLRAALRAVRRPLWLTLHVDRRDVPYEHVTIGSRPQKRGLTQPRNN